ncbi:OLC1v1004734C1 [Oldenlandia corymbosa var. corymbosa]|uniref:OLC1v1004734C1 n=1 Tax=Oldenlandia corymbosa var. corymbosa TaxID=529605 RepID=A0AAV1DFG1_OLDCO|nr:OLC1v1004734C1 [Oldenlandia corymbosa var. corymbosa]
MEVFLHNRLLLLGFLLVFYVYGLHYCYGAPKKTVGLHEFDPSPEPSYLNFGISLLNRTSFPPGFLFGASTSSYQVEGGWNADGKGLSNWDYFTHKYPEKIANCSNGDVAADSYHRYKEDIKLLNDMNADSYRFSISWSRVIPSGRICQGINENGIQYYNNLIDELLANQITPMVTIFHWELPQALEDDYGGFLSPAIISDYHDYVNLCFERFGDRVKIWITFNEPFTYSMYGYDSGETAPGRCSSWVNPNCAGGDSGVEPYIVSHHQLLAHANATHLYRTRYQQQGIIGMANVAIWMVPLTNKPSDQRAAIRALDFIYGWFMNPLVFGDYPEEMKILVGDRLPRFTQDQSELLKGSYDFHALNYYTALYASAPVNASDPNCPRYSTDKHVDLSATRFGVPIGEQAASDWLHIYPRGIYHLLLYIKRKYGNPVIYITENGVDDVNNASLPLVLALQDRFRIRYHYRHLQFIRRAIEKGVQVKGYYGWSLIDNFEWQDGYTFRFGINYVDFETLQRFRKLSSLWFERFLSRMN